MIQQRTCYSEKCNKQLSYETGKWRSIKIINNYLSTSNDVHTHKINTIYF